MKKTFSLIAAALVFVACQTSEPEKPAVEAVFEVDETALEFDAKGGEAFKSVTSNGNWTATPSAEWITVDPASSEGTTKRKKSVTITVAENTAEEAREGSVVIRQDELSATIAIKQAAAEKQADPDDGNPKYPAYDSSKPIFVGWNNYVLSDASGVPYAHDVNNGLIRGSAIDYSWSSGARFPAPTGSDFNAINNRAFPTAANHPNPLGAYISACDYGLQHIPVAAGTTTASGAIDGPAGFSFNPGFQVQKMLADDFLFVCIPVKNLKPTQKITFETSIGGAASAAGLFVVEYSTNFNTTTYAGDWYTAAGGTVYGPEAANATTQFTGASTLAGAQGQVFHVWNTWKNQRTAEKGGTRYVYSKDTAVDDGYTKLVFPLDKISEVADGFLYVRMRSFFGMRANEGNSATAGGWTDFKFVEVTIE